MYVTLLRIPCSATYEVMLEMHCLLFPPPFCWSFAGCYICQINAGWHDHYTRYYLKSCREELQQGRRNWPTGSEPVPRWSYKSHAL